MPPLSDVRQRRRTAHSRNRRTTCLLGQARGLSFFNGFFDQSACLWSRDGRLLVTSHQIVYYKE